MKRLRCLADARKKIIMQQAVGCQFERYTGQVDEVDALLALYGGLSTIRSPEMIDQRCYIER